MPWCICGGGGVNVVWCPCERSSGDSRQSQKMLEILEFILVQGLMIFRW
jgi:hypothetical protein